MATKIDGMKRTLDNLKRIQTNVARLGRAEGQAGIFPDHRANIPDAPSEHPANYMWWQNYGYTLRNGRKMAGRHWVQKTIDKNERVWMNQFQAYAAAVAKGQPWDEDFMQSLMGTVAKDLKSQIVESDVLDTTEGYESVIARVKKV